VGATIARVISLKQGIPIIGANHCVAHLEIGRTLGASDPVLLYASGANTQVIAYVRERYRVLGETLDIGIGNMLDKVGRDIGIPFPAGPLIEKLAAGIKVSGVWEGRSEDIELHELPYSVKGMDVSFSGIMTAALSLKEKGVPIPSICHSLQETCFSMLCEVTERAMAHIGTDEVLLGGGVACNGRLKDMAGKMASERGGKIFAPPPSLSVDNGAMIAYLGEIMFRSGIEHSMEDTIIDQKFRTDQVDVTWKEKKEFGEIRTRGIHQLSVGEVPTDGTILGKGAEATITKMRYGEIESVEKIRIPKGYRHPLLESRLTSSRVRKEARMLSLMKDSGIRTPYLLEVDPENGRIVMELIEGPRLASVLNVIDTTFQIDALEKMGNTLGTLHSNGMVHGDMTTSNFLITAMDNGKIDLCLLDTSLSDRTDEIERMGVDLRLFFEVFSSTHPDLLDLSDHFWKGYLESFPSGNAARKKLDEINSRGRYMSQNWT
jgi:N6-L-threonylcarbamoyladenine synthase/protein kinase Bud32